MADQEEVELQKDGKEIESVSQEKSGEIKSEAISTNVNEETTDIKQGTSDETTAGTSANIKNEASLLKPDDANDNDASSTSEPNTCYGFDGKNHTYTDPKDGQVYVWDRDKNGWFPKVDEDFLAQYQMNYGFVDNTSSADKEEETEKEVMKEAEKRKAPQEPGWFEISEEHNTKVYVSNLPKSITEQEFVDIMQKCGLVMRDVNTNKWKIKLYYEEDGKTPKGDAICSYIKKESVELALTVLDGSEYNGETIHVERAKFQMKGSYNPALKPKKKRKKEKEREKKMQQKLFDWRPDKMRGERENHERTVIVKNLFDPVIFDNDMSLILEYTQDLREECSKCGVIRKLVLHDKHLEGIAQVTFSDAEEADICIKLLNNRWFGQRKITAETWDGKTKYKVAESEVEVKARLDNWNKFLEQEEAKKAT